MDIHILTQDKDVNTVNAIFHIPIPAALNEAGISYRDVIVMKTKGGITSALYNITPAELALLQSGAEIERVETVRFSSIYLTNAQRLQQIIDRYNAVRTALMVEKQITLNFMGYNTEVV